MNKHQRTVQEIISKCKSVQKKPLLTLLTQRNNRYKQNFYPHFSLNRSRSQKKYFFIKPEKQKFKTNIKSLIHLPLLFQKIKKNYSPINASKSESTHGQNTAKKGVINQQITNYNLIVKYRERLEQERRIVILRQITIKNIKLQTAKLRQRLIQKKKNKN